MHEVQAMVLAAGLGTRLWPLTVDRAKPAVPFLGKPLVTWVMELLLAHRVPRAVVNTHHQPESVTRAVHALFGIELSMSHEATILGTAGALAKARDERLLASDRTTLVINAKLFTDLDLSRALAAHRETGARVTMVLRRNHERALFREVKVEGPRVVGFGASARPEGDSPLLFTGLHLIEPEVLAAIPAGRECDTIRDVYPALIEAGQVHAHLADQGRWWEFSTLARYLDLHQQAFREGLSGDVVLGPAAHVEPGAEVTASVLWENAAVGRGARLDQVVLGAGVRIPPGMELSRVAVIRRALISEPMPKKAHLEGDLVVVPLDAA